MYSFFLHQFRTAKVTESKKRRGMKEKYFCIVHEIRKCTRKPNISHIRLSRSLVNYSQDMCSQIEDQNWWWSVFMWPTVINWMQENSYVDGWSLALLLPDITNCCDIYNNQGNISTFLFYRIYHSHPVYLQISECKYLNIQNFPYFSCRRYRTHPTPVRVTWIIYCFTYKHEQEENRSTQ